MSPALFRSDDNEDNWTEITRSRPFHWCNGFDFDPKNSSVLYLASCNNHADPQEGGLWRTSNGGGSWEQVLGPEDFKGKSGPEPDTLEGMFVTIAPHDPQSIYLGATAHGLWISRDGGDTWKQSEGIPFAAIHRVTFDPDDPEKVYVTSFGGGVWMGAGL